MKFYRSLLVALALCTLCDPGMAAAQSSPSPRSRAAMAYDSHRDVIVLFGGLTDAGLSNETWEWDGTSWLLRTPSSAPTPRGDTDLAFDRVRGVTTLFSGGGEPDDTWEWDGNDWTQRFPVNSPGGRRAHSLTYDASTGQTILFGGAVTTCGDLNDTWAWDGTNWTELAPAVAPPVRQRQSVAYDPSRGQIVMFGGHDACGGNRGDAWTWDGSAWTELLPIGTTPVPLFGAPFAPLPGGMGLVLHGGCDPSGHTAYGSTWLLDGSTWVDATPSAHPGSRTAHSMALHEGTNQVLLFGGATTFNGALLGDTWTFNGTSWCNLGTAPATDCNGNGYPDSCDISTGISHDCNSDGVPDECEIAADATLDLNANGTLDACEAIGTTYCSPAVVNSTGLPGVVTILGNETVFLNDFKVSARQLPASAFGYFIASTTPGSVFPVSNSVGTLCVIGSVGRGVGGGIVNSGPDGYFYGSVNLNAMPQPVGTVMVQPGDTWHFQAWHRDASGGQTTSNFTDAVAVTFQ